MIVFLSFGDRSFNTLFNKFVNAIFTPGNPFNMYTHVVIVYETGDGGLCLVDNHNGDPSIVTETLHYSLEELISYLVNSYGVRKNNVPSITNIQIHPYFNSSYAHMIHHVQRRSFWVWLKHRLGFTTQAPLICTNNARRILESVTAQQISASATIPELMTIANSL